MARKNKLHPSLLKGYPQDGDVYEEPNEEFAEDDDEDDEAERYVQPAAHGDPRIERLEREMELMRRENEDLRRRTPPANAPEPEPEEPDWEELIFKSPAEAARLIEDRAVTRAEQKLRREYQKDQGEAQFWSDFYKNHDDLADDDDMVRMVLSNNLDKLGGMPVSDAMNELADLTRKRIMAYSNRKGRGSGKRAMAEGASPPQGRRPAPAENKVVTLCDIISNRRDKRRKAASAA